MMIPLYIHSDHVREIRPTLRRHPAQNEYYILSTYLYIIYNMIIYRRRTQGRI